MVKAGSLAYAILICVVVGIFCYVLLMMSNYSKIHQTMLFTYSELVANNESAQQYFLNKIDNSVQKEATIDLFDNGIVTTSLVKPWGVYTVLTTRSIFRKDTITQTVLVGGKQKKDGLALYLADNGKALFMVDKAKIIGNAALPKRSIRPGYITNNSFRNTNFLSGSKSASDRVLPKIRPSFFEYESSQVDRVNAEDLKDPNIIYYRSFTEKTLYIDADQIILNKKKLSGNIVVESRDSIYIRRDNVLDNIIIKAPKVVFEKGFEGTVQVIAEQLVELEEDVVLKYPSSILITKKGIIKKEVTLHQGGKVLGAIVVFDQDRSANKLITINEKAEVIGDVYCSGKTQLKGTVIGTVYTNNFYLSTKSSIYDNYIMNGVIDRKNLPDNFVRAALFEQKSNDKITYAIIKSL